MSWISGRTISPASGELVFMIDENANLPPSQDWVQFWEVCGGIEPIKVGAELACWDSMALVLRQGQREGDEAAVGWLRSVTEYRGERDQLRDADVDPMLDCRISERTLTIQMVNFDVTDNGDSVFETKGCVDSSCDIIAIYVRTRGLNPSRAALNAALPDDIMRAICWQESRWRHFLPNGKPLVNSNPNGTTDWGLMQINQATNEQKWNWRSNLAAAIALFAQKRAAADAYLRKHPPYSPEMLENETIQRYNGGAYYKWDAQSGTWMVSPPNGYVKGIRDILAQKPWETLASLAAEDDGGGSRRGSNRQQLHAQAAPRA